MGRSIEARFADYRKIRPGIGQRLIRQSPFFNMEVKPLPELKPLTTRLTKIESFVGLTLKPRDTDKAYRYLRDLFVSRGLPRFTSASLARSILSRGTPRLEYVEDLCKTPNWELEEVPQIGENGIKAIRKIYPEEAQ